MKNSFKVARVIPMFNSTRPMVVIELENAPTIFRHPKLALIDLHNSGRCLRVPQDALDNGVANMHPIQKESFFLALKELAGTTVTGDTVIFQAGDKYAVTKGHPALTDVNHKAFGIKEGEFLIAEKGGHRVEGFLEFPFTAEEKLTRMLVDSQAGTNALLALFGASNTASFAVPTPVAEVVAPTIPTVMPAEAFEEYDAEQTTADATVAPEPILETATDIALGKGNKK
jgi:hypothetical protein